MTRFMIIELTPGNYVAINIDKITRMEPFSSGDTDDVKLYFDYTQFVTAVDTTIPQLLQTAKVLAL